MAEQWTRHDLREALRRDRRRVAIERAGPLPPGTFPVILADPPWAYDFAETESRHVENLSGGVHRAEHYAALDLDQICALPVPAAPDAVLFLWATSPKVAEALQVVEAWGFTYRTMLVWIKDRVGMGYWARQRHELVLIGGRGDVRPPEPEARPDSVIEAPRGRYSEKPEAVYLLLERLWPELPKLEMFQVAPRLGWVGWGSGHASVRV